MQAQEGAVTTLNRESIIAAIQHFNEMWNRGDIASACEVFADDVIVINSDGLTRGKENILKHYLIRYPNGASMGTSSFEIVKIDLSGTVGIKTTMAIATVQWALQFEGGNSIAGFGVETFRIIGDKVRITLDVTV